MRKDLGEILKVRYRGRTKVRNNILTILVNCWVQGG